MAKYMGLTVQPVRVVRVVASANVVRIIFERSDIYRNTVYELSARDARQLGRKLHELLGPH